MFNPILLAMMASMAESPPPLNEKTLRKESISHEVGAMFAEIALETILEVEDDQVKKNHIKIMLGMKKLNDSIGELRYFADSHSAQNDSADALAVIEQMQSKVDDFLKHHKKPENTMWDKGN